MDGLVGLLQGAALPDGWVGLSESIDGVSSGMSLVLDEGTTDLGIVRLGD